MHWTVLLKACNSEKNVLAASEFVTRITDVKLNMIAVLLHWFLVLVLHSR